MQFRIPESCINSIDSSIRSFQIIYIPSDVNQEIKEESVIQPEGKALNAMLDYCKNRFKLNLLSGANLLEYQKQIAQEQKQIAQEHIQKLAEMTLCEVVPILQNSKKTLYIGVNLVVDDKAVSKNSSLNDRATSICARCGLSIQIRGDAFICRQFDNDEGFYRLNFSLKDLSEVDDSIEVDPIWISLAKALRFNDEKLIEKCSKDYKEHGNEFYKKLKFKEAIFRYSQAFILLSDISKSSSILELKSQILSNQSACRLKLGDSIGALSDADACLVLRPKWNKAWCRRSEALKALGREEESKEALEKAGLN